MIKKLFLCAALVGAVGLTSCVDDVETASVQAIRGAKAEQYKANADFSNAQAEAAILKANAVKATKESAAAAAQAQADYKKAQAENLKAQAALKEAQTAAKNAKTESDKAAAAVEVERLKARLAQEQQILEKKKLQVEDATNKLQQTLAQYDQDIAAANVTAQSYKDKLEALVYEKADAEYTNLSGLVTNYTTAYSTLNDLQALLYRYTTDLAKFQAGITSNVQLTQNIIAGYQEDNNQLNLEIAELEAQKETFTTTEYSNAKKELEKLQTEAIALNDAVTAAQNAQSSAYNAYSSANDQLSNCDYVEAADKLWSNSYFYQNKYGTNIQNDSVPYLNIDLYFSWDQSQDPSMYKMYYFNVNSDEGDMQIPLFSNIESEQITLKASYTQPNDLVDNIATETYYEYNPEKYYALDTEGADSICKVLDANIARMQLSVKYAESTIKNANDKSANLKTLKADYDKKNKAVIDLKKPAADATQEAIDKYNADKKAADDALTAATEALVKVIKSVNQSYKTVDYYNNAVSDLNNLVSKTTDNMNDLINSAIPTAQKYTDKIEGYINTMKNAGSATAQVEAYNKANKENAQAILDLKIAEGNVAINNSQQAACNQIINFGTTADGTNISDKISVLNQQIEDKKNKIEENNNKITEEEGKLAENKIDDDELVAKYNAQIATTESKIAAQQELVDAAKAALDAALAEDAPAEN